jgi:NAD(P)-dependent dehydrogenase (short-subunit alcohol dehydrogenase family)
MTGRRALVTGGTQGIGEAVVTRLRDAGAKVLTTARSPAGTPAQTMHARAKA